MARGRKKAAPTITTLEAYKTELQRLEMLKVEAEKNLCELNDKITKIKDLIRDEEMKELWSLMESKGISVNDMKELLISKETEENIDKNVEISEE